MKEKLYAIPVNDAFNENCECPICKMYETLEKDAVDYTMGPSYMEDDIRMKTDEMGFCNRHIKMVFDKENRLGMGLVINTHLNRVNKELKELIDITSGTAPKKNSLFSKKIDTDNAIINYINNLECKCFVCDKIENVFERYLITIYHLYNTDPDFVKKYKESNGFCIGHYRDLLKYAPKYISSGKLKDFIDTTNSLFISNMERVNDDVAWFVAKFDYRNENEPWKNAKDSLPRALVKLHQKD